MADVLPGMGLLRKNHRQVHSGGGGEGHGRQAQDRQPVRGVEVEHATDHQRDGGTQPGKDRPGPAPALHPVHPDADAQVGQPRQVGDEENQEHVSQREAGQRDPFLPQAPVGTHDA